MHQHTEAGGQTETEAIFQASLDPVGVTGVQHWRFHAFFRTALRLGLARAAVNCWR